MIISSTVLMILYFSEVYANEISLNNVAFVCMIIIQTVYLLAY